MSETNGDTPTTVAEIQMPDGRFFKAPVYDLKYDIDELEEEMEKAAPDGKFVYRQFCTRVAELLKEKYRLEITRGEADFLKDQIDILYAKKKQRSRDEWRVAANLPSSTESPPQG